MRHLLRSFILSFLLTSLAIAALACAPDPATDPAPVAVDTTGTGGADHGGASEWTCGSYKGHTLYTGPKGGCYYYNSSGNKTYVDRSNCNC